jgi:hypothetical protein
MAQFCSRYRRPYTSCTCVSCGYCIGAHAEEVRRGVRQVRELHCRERDGGQRVRARTRRSL